MKRKLLFLSSCMALGALMLHVGIASNSGESDLAGPSMLLTETGSNDLGDSVAVLHQQPVHYLNDQGDISRVDLSFEESDTGFANRTNTMQSFFAREYGEGWQVSLSGSAVRFESVAMGLRTDDGFEEFARPDASAQGRIGDQPNALLFDETYAGISDAFSVRRGGLEHVVLVESRDDLPGGDGELAFVYRVTLPDGLVMNYHPLEFSETPDGAEVSLPFMEIANLEGKAVAIIPTPHLWDSSESPIAAGGNLDWEQTSPSEGYLTVRVSNRVLDEMTFPVRIDPAVQEVLGPINTITGAAWGHFDFLGNVVMVRFNGNFFGVGSYVYDFGAPYGVSNISDIVATPAFDISGIPSKVKRASIGFRLLIDSYGGRERVEINDHKTDVLNFDISSAVFAANIADGRNSEPFAGWTGDHSKDATYNKADEFADEDADPLTLRYNYRLGGKAVKDINDSLKGKVKTVSALPLPAGLFAVAFHDTSEFNDQYLLYLYDVQLTLEYNMKDEDPDLP